MPSLPPGDTSSHGHVLVVDDDRATRRFMKVQLEDAGFDVSIADSGDRCLELAINLQPEVIVLDLNMPGMGGIETCRRLRAAAATHDIPVLFLTGRQDDEAAVVRALEAGANDFVSKDSSRAVLVARLRSQVAISRAHYKLREMSLVDEVSGAWSKAYLHTTLRGALKAMTRPRRKTLMCVVADVAGIAEVNQRIGFRGGDEVMRAIGAALMATTRETDVVARLDGARFGVLLVDTDVEGARAAIDRMMSQVVAATKLATVSFGVAKLADVALDALRDQKGIDDTIDDLVKRAILVGHVAEREGKGAVVLDGETVLPTPKDDGETTAELALAPPDSEPTGVAQRATAPDSETGVEIEVDIDVDLAAAASEPGDDTVDAAAPDDDESLAETGSGDADEPTKISSAPASESGPPPRVPDSDD